MSGSTVPAAGPKSVRFMRGVRHAIALAQREFDRGRLKEAIDVLEEALARRLDSAALRTMLGIAYARTRQIDRAFEHLELGLALDPGAFGPRCALGELYMRLCIPEVAREHFEQALGRARSMAERTYVVNLLREQRIRGGRAVHLPTFRQPLATATGQPATRRGSRA